MSTPGRGPYLLMWRIYRVIIVLHFKRDIVVQGRTSHLRHYAISGAPPMCTCGRTNGPGTRRLRPVTGWYKSKRRNRIYERENRKHSRGLWLGSKGRTGKSPDPDRGV